VWLPPFWVERPAVWFAQAEAQFFLAGVNSEKTKFFHVISQLDHRYAAEVEDITFPPERDPYTTLRTELVQWLFPSREQRIRQLLTPEEMGDRKPSQFLRHLRGLDLTCQKTSCTPSGPAGYPPTYRPFSPVSRSAAWTPQPAVQTASPRWHPSRRSLALVTSPNNTTLLQEIVYLSRQVAALSAEQDRLRTSFRDPPLSTRDPCSSTRYPDSGPRNRLPNSRSPSRGDTAPTLCWYHRCFGPRAQKCTPPCAFHQQEN
jgi:hypothetical protein